MAADVSGLVAGASKGSAAGDDSAAGLEMTAGASGLATDASEAEGAEGTAASGPAPTVAGHCH